jgi:hypothetical protein
MATLHFDEHSTVSFGGIDLSGLVTGISFDPEPMAAHMERVSSTFDGLKPVKLKFRGYWDPSPALYRALFRRSHPRIRRMHTAYGRRRGPGRW